MVRAESGLYIVSENLVNKSTGQLGEQTLHPAGLFVGIIGFCALLRSDLVV